MKAIKRLLETPFNKTWSTTTECANCWGYQEWAEGRKEANWRPRKEADGFIMKFVKRYLRK